MSTDALLALHAAAAPFLGASRRPTRRQLALREAIVRVCRERGRPEIAAPIWSAQEALRELAVVLKRCEAACVAWPDVVALVNRDYGSPAPTIHPVIKES